MSDDTDDIDEMIRLIREGREVRIVWDGIEMTLTEHHIDDLLLAREMRQYLRESYEALTGRTEGDTT